MIGTVGEKLGRIFELGFNIGLAEYLHKQNLNASLLAYYRRELGKIPFHRLVKQIVAQEKVIGSEDASLLEKWVFYYLARGFLAGRNFLPEYLAAIGWTKIEKLELIYFQANFGSDNTFGLNPQNQEQFATDMLKQFGLTTHEVDWQLYSRKGEFLKADSLLLLRYRGKYLRILALDLSVFSVREMTDLADLGNVEVLRRQLMKELSYLKSKSVFANLGMDTGEFNLASDLATYFTAFKRQDKETVKLIQAASYAHSFYNFLKTTDFLKGSFSELIVNVLGYSDRGMSSLAVSSKNFKLLETCAHIYKQPTTEETISQARERVLNVTWRNTARAFQNGRDFLERLTQIPPGRNYHITHSEQIEGFLSTEAQLTPATLASIGLENEPTSLNLRQAHAKFISGTLVNPQENFVFLTGNPGIGKTTTVINFLKAHSQEGFLFLYVSPRKQVNLDVLNKFRSEDAETLFSDALLGLNTNADIIRANDGKPTVHYLSNVLNGIVDRGGVSFLPTPQLELDDSDSLDNLPTGLTRIFEDVIQDTGGLGAGVLASICQALHAAISFEMSNNLIATVSIQSLKQTVSGEDTLKHFGKIFKSAYNERDNRVLPTQMQEISKRVKHLFIMVDEITGDDSGAAFLNRLLELLIKYELLNGQHGFNTKVIVADASIVDSAVITQHLQESEREDKVEPAKVFFRQTEKAVAQLPALSCTKFNFNSYPATLINANSYPASKLNITYNAFIESYKPNLRNTIEDNFNITKIVQNRILEDLSTSLDKLGDNEQILVYIQDKRRLSELITKLDKMRGGFTDYLCVHADISEAQKRRVQFQANHARVVFMTASASRGLSFPKARTILVDIPRFEVENNLMEIIQVIYRGRGFYWNEDSGASETYDDKSRNLVFYLGERVAYYTEDEATTAISFQEGILSLVSIFLILKTSIMTRIQGYGQIGHDYYLMIPVGGKAVSAAGETFANRMSTLTKELEKQHYLDASRFQDKLLKQLYTELRRLLSSSDILLTPANPKTELGAKRLNQPTPKTERSYLNLRRKFVSEFKTIVNKGLDNLLDFDQVEFGYIQGSLLIVPLKDKTVQENYLMRLADELEKWFKNPQLWGKMTGILRDTSYPESLRQALVDAKFFINKLSQRQDKTQWFTQRTRRSDLYYAFPLFAFISEETLATYYIRETQDSEAANFKDLLSQYIRTLFPADGILPIGSKYTDFPFIVFKSYSLREMRSKAFTEKYMLTSRELNVLNLILSQDL